MSDTRELDILETLAEILEQLSIPYAIGGSIASSIYGTVRFTADADITVEPFHDRADRLFDLLSPQFYISKQTMNQALAQQTGFNIIHLDSAFKIDVFIRRDTRFERQLIARRRLIRLSPSSQKLLPVLSPEDIILVKLQWYRSAGCTSQRQWDDVLGILAVQAETLDFDYLKKWAVVLELGPLLEKCISQSKRTW
ncbi:MAG: hypothetical protein ACYS9T_05080 [Planctomycetota bacterium]|jgi:hypothetical protein